jgi:hypothetical protein
MLLAVADGALLSELIRLHPFVNYLNVLIHF